MRSLPKRLAKFTLLPLAFLLVTSPLVAKTTITTEAAAENLRGVMFRAAVPAPDGEAKTPKLVDAKGKAVPCQARIRGGRARLSWLVGSMAKGEKGAWTLSWTAEKAKSAVALVEEPGGQVRVDIDGDLFTRYVFGPKEAKPYLYPILVDKTTLTRHYPMKTGVEGERSDHPHHRSFYFTHGDVNGVSFWHEDGKKTGRIVHTAFRTVRSGAAQGVLRTQQNWVMPGGEVVLADARSYRFFSPASGCLLYTSPSPRDPD